MRIKRTGKCAVCKTPVVIYRDFQATADIFNPTQELPLRAELKQQLLDWREQELLCGNHSPTPGTPGWRPKEEPAI